MDPFEIARLPPEEAIGALRSRPDGLTAEEAAARLRDDGPNEIPVAHGPGAVRRFVDQVTHFFALLLWVAAVLAYIGGLPQLAIAIVVVVLVNAAFSFVQEERAERATAALRDLLPVESTVIRTGRTAAGRARWAAAGAGGAGGACRAASGPGPGRAGCRATAGRARADRNQ